MSAGTAGVGGGSGSQAGMAAAHDRLHGKGGQTAGPDLQPPPFSKATYTEAQAKDSKLDQYIKDRKKYKAGSTEYENLQAKINAAYSHKRSEKVKRHK